MGKFWKSASCKEYTLLSNYYFVIVIDRFHINKKILEKREENERRNYYLYTNKWSNFQFLIHSFLLPSYFKLRYLANQNLS